MWLGSDCAKYINNYDHIMEVIIIEIPSPVLLDCLQQYNSYQKSPCLDHNIMKCVSLKDYSNFCYSKYFFFVICKEITH